MNAARYGFSLIDINDDIILQIQMASKAVKW